MNNFTIEIKVAKSYLAYPRVSKLNFLALIWKQIQPFGPELYERFSIILVGFASWYHASDPHDLQITMIWFFPSSFKNFPNCLTLLLFFISEITKPPQVLLAGLRHKLLKHLLNTIFEFINQTTILSCGLTFWLEPTCIWMEN